MPKRSFRSVLFGLVTLVPTALAADQSSMEAFPAEVQTAILNSAQFELSYRARLSVTQDSFYSAPPDTSHVAPGTLLKVERETNASLYTLAPNLSLSRFMYQSQTLNGTFVPVSGYVLWPYIAKPHDRGFPVVAWAHGTSGIHAECAPSNIKNLWHHFQAPYQLALNGYVVVATDYAGLGVSKDANGKSIIHEYLHSTAQANDVLFSVPAARAAFPDLSEDFVILGSSQGGSAAWAAAEKLVDEPMEGHLGTVVLSPVTRLIDLPETEAIVPLIVLMMTPALMLNNPGMEASDLLDETGVQDLNIYQQQNGCNTVLFNLPAPGLVRGWQNVPAVQKYTQTSNVGRKPISGPMLVMTGDSDPLIYNPSVTSTVNETAQLYPDVQLDYYLLPDVSHAPAMYSGWQVYNVWISDLFAGRRVNAGLRSHNLQPVRPKSAQQIEANWYIQNVTASWQQT